MNLLTTDLDYFKDRYSSAVSFLVEAELRFDLYVLLQRRHHGSLNEYEKYRLRSLWENVKSFSQPWFMQKLEREGLLPNECDV